MYIDKLYYPSNGRFSINSLVSEEYAKFLRLLNREQQIKESYECFCNLVHTEFFTLKSHKSKKEKNVINKKLLTNAASKKKRMDEKLERAMEIHVKWNLKDRSSWKKDYCLKAGEGERNNLYSKLEGLYTIGENQTSTSPLVHASIHDIGMFYHNTSGITISKGDTRMYGSNKAIGECLRESRKDVDKFIVQQQSMYIKSDTILFIILRSFS